MMMVMITILSIFRNSYYSIGNGIPTITGIYIVASAKINRTTQSYSNSVLECWLHYIIVAETLEMRF